MLCIGICDDSYDARFALRSALERLLEPRQQTARILEFSSGEGLLRWQSHHPGELHLVFLDLEMNQLDGMETARRLRQTEPGMQLAFVTGYDSHVYEGYQVGALGYLLKPPKAAQLADVLDRATAILTQTNTAFSSAAAGRSPTASPMQRFSTSSRIVGRSPALPRTRNIPSTANWTRWPRRWALLSCASTSVTWSGSMRCANLLATKSLWGITSFPSAAPVSMQPCWP